MNKPDDIPTVDEKSEEELNAIYREIEASALAEPTKAFITSCIESALWFPHILEQKNIGLRRLRTMVFGKGYRLKKTIEEHLKNKESDNDLPTEPDETAVDTDESTSKTTTQKIELQTHSPKDADAVNDTDGADTKKTGHGRMPHTVYEDYTAITLPIEGFKVGDVCPKLCGGKLYDFEPKKLRVIVRIKGQAFASVYKYIVARLRCNLCDYLIQATIPDSIGTEKYDASFKALLVLQKYYVAVPFYRQEVFQRLLKFPLPDATQWDLVEKVAGFCYRPFAVLMRLAANGTLIHNDDTGVKIQEVIQEIKANPDKDRTGMFTTGILSSYEGHKIALFLNGTQHSGENLTELLQKRKTNKPPIIQMCDALSCNVPKSIETIVCNCLSHGFRKFEELQDYFPIPCITIMKLLSQVYTNDALTKEMTKAQRLAYHQTHSQPVMDTLAQYMQALLDEKHIEPNSEMGKAIKYMQKHWHKLTRFLTIPGAPLCNNVLERALKIAIRNRKSAMFYRTRYSAHIGGMLTSLIYTCELADANPHDYLIQLQTYASDVYERPEEWLPWNYLERLTVLTQTGPPENPKECQSAQANLAAA